MSPNPLIRQGAGPNDLHRLHTEHAAQRARLETIIRSSEHADTKPVCGGTPAGDNQRLRGIPAIGPGVTGAIPGTTPGQ